MAKLRRCVVLLFIQFVLAQESGISDHYPNYYKTGKNRDVAGVKTSRKGGTKTVSKSHSSGYGYSGGYSGVNYAPHGSAPVSDSLDTISVQYSGGCTKAPRAPLNSQMRCSQYSGCRASCAPGFQFPNGDSQLFITCLIGVWKVEGAGWDSIPSCEPKCMPQCENNGICVGPNQCDCPENYLGPQCQFENKPCVNYPTLPLNSRRTCSSTQCTITCMPGHEFPGGLAISTLLCKDGQWKPSRSEWAIVPDCQATCTPGCQNGGNCLAFNVCQCPQDYRGPQCQYRADSCTPKRMNFNGGYNCSGNSDSFHCSLNCPDGVPFEYPPTSYYTCTYATGVFTPSPIPQCVYGTNMDIIPITGGKDTYYETVNSNFSFEDLLPDMSIGRNAWSSGSFIQNERLINDSNIKSAHMGQYGTRENRLLTFQEVLPSPGTCFTWGGAHFKTFDGKVFSFDSDCAHTLIRDAVDSSFSVIVQNSAGCSTGTGGCYRKVHLYMQNKEYTLKKSDTGVPILMQGKRRLPMPTQVPGLRADLSAHYIVVSLDSIGLTLRWDGEQLVQAQISEALWNRTEGLCGRIDGHIENDMTAKDGSRPRSVATLAASWQSDILGHQCDTTPTEDHQCVDNSQGKAAQTFCKRLLADQRFAQCHSVMDIGVLLDACRWDFCACKSEDATTCACNTMNVYIRECQHKGVKTIASWRDEDTCPMSCIGGRVYLPCGPAGGQATCGASLSPPPDDTNEDICEEGCYCPFGTVLHDGKCVTRDKCPCRLRGKSFAPGDTVAKDCNTCTCVEGHWVCTQVSCGARCSAIGDPHYQTFDGKRFDLMGQCSYYLVKGANFSVEAENVACAGAISAAMNFPVSIASGLPSCTKTVTIRTELGSVIKLKQNREVVVNGEEVTELPYSLDGAYLRVVSSLFIVLELESGLQVWWDGMTRVYVDAPASFKDETRGLCGTFNSNQKDDFLTPDGDIEQTVVPFANKWKTDEKCKDVLDIQKPHPCEVNVHNKVQAELHCGKIKSSIFSSCHWHVDPEPFYQDCLYDMCSCETQLAKCLCPIIAAYAKDCAHRGAIVEWRTEVRECGVHCPGGQTYQVCGDSCSRSCADISARPNCEKTCVEGCNCPGGEALDDHGECISVGRCQCRHDGLEFPPGYKEIRPATRGQELCTCANGVWNCRPAQDNEIAKFPKPSDLKAKCSNSANFEFTTCEPVDPVTCRNMHAPPANSPAVCRPGCQCKRGFVFDSYADKCVAPSSCPCHHGGRSYYDGETVQNDCNTCKCAEGKWTCGQRICPAVCSVWGDSHYKTFDGRLFDYQGQCDYILAKGNLGKHDHFDLTVQNVPCSTLGVSCSRAITLKAGSEQVTLTRDRPIPLLTAKRLTLRVTDLFVIVESEDLGLTLHWDRGTRVYLRIDPRWKGRVKGLCGNYNDNQLDDFQTPSGGFSEVSAKLFGDSWRLQPYCPEAPEVVDACAERPNRKLWATKRCGLLKSPIFAICHSEVPVGPYLERCVFDTCACDQGGDCECLCTALAAYAQECNTRGVPVHWRSNDLCPIQCDERCSKYTACISPCPLETCDNLLNTKHHAPNRLCVEDSCIEGCLPKACPPSQVHLNASALECVPRATCKPICMEIDGVIFSEGDIIEEDACHSCYCTRSKKVCTGKPCTTTVPPVSHMMEQILDCRNGWTEWINQDRQPPKKGTKGGKLRGRTIDLEPLPSPLLLNSLSDGGRCGVSQMWDIQCRTVDGHIDPKATGLDVECSLERGLICKADRAKRIPCPDFEIRVLCDCDERSTTPQPHESCDVAVPHREHTEDCHLFYHCAPGQHGYELVEKSCGPHMLYNPKSMICDWPQSVFAIRPECEKLEEETGAEPPRKKKPKKPTSNGDDIFGVEEVPGCPDGYIYSPCAVECQRLCLYYSYAVRQKGTCLTGDACEEGCIFAARQLSCPPGMIWRDNTTCVGVADCTCVAHDGTPVKPGTVHKESDCEICQCIQNHYTCDRSACPQASLEELPEPEINEDLEAPPPLLVKTTVTPPAECDEHKYVYLIDGDNPISDHSFTASTFLNEKSAPEHSKLHSKPAGSWSPATTDRNQYLQVDLGRIEPIYGVLLMGNPVFDEFVTSYHMLHSSDGHKFGYVATKGGAPQLFRGPIDQYTPQRQMFDVPVEAKVVRINPQSWHNGISIRADLIGCGEPITTTSATIGTTNWDLIEPIEPIATMAPMCNDPMGLEERMMSDQQLSVSSEFSPNNTKSALRLDSPYAWRPLTNTPNEWVKFDFLAARNLTGLETRGGPDGWVSAYNVKYSHDDYNWNPILDDYSNERLFLGNIDQDTPHLTQFERPVQAQYLKVVPKKWTNNIEMRVEPKGCYEAYPPLKPTAPPPTGSPDCNDCPGQEPVTPELSGHCRCNETLWWDGENCVGRAQCPCMIGHIPYAVGTVFEKEDCSQCLCTLGGVAQCTPKQCDDCEVGLRGTFTAGCECVCKPCPLNQVLCPTSNICINVTSWCNGVVECPDDEIHCATTPGTTLEPAKTTKVTELESNRCPEVKCPPGYTAQQKKLSRYEELHSNLSPMFYMYGGRKSTPGVPTKGGAKGGRKSSYLGSRVLPKKTAPEKLIKKEEECPQFRCVTDKRPPDFIHTTRPCPPVECPPKYRVVFEAVDDVSSRRTCPKYECVPPPVRDAVCNVTGRTFNTFDDTEFKYDICNHVLARDLFGDDWDVSLVKNCTTICVRDLIVRHGDQLVKMFSDLSLEFNGYRYTVEQTKKIGAKNRSFIVSRLGDTLLFVSNYYGFWLMWDRLANVRIGITSKLLGQVDGLCGFYDDLSMNDKRKPDGKPARTTVEFGDSWALGDQSVCEARVCPLHVQNHAWKMCNRVKEDILKPCAEVLDLDGWVSRCLETACTCLETGQDEECRCQTVEAFVVECRTAQPNVELDDWRMQLECPASCPAPLVHHDCYRRRCEPSCANLAEPDACPTLPQICFPGCYCPAGLVRKKDACVPPRQCRDCECNVLPHLEYVTFDGANYSADTNCSYVMARNTGAEHDFQLLVSNGPCPLNSNKMCPNIITLIYNSTQTIEIKRDESNLQMILNDVPLTKLPFNNTWGTFNRLPAKHLNVLIPNLQLELRVYYPTLGASLKLSSHAYSGKTEGICGNCNRKPEDDNLAPTGKALSDKREFVESWIALNGTQCTEALLKECVPTGDDPCLVLMDPDRFGQCHVLLDPAIFLATCHHDTCGGRPELACSSLETYALGCRAQGLCVDHHTELCPVTKCPDGTEYKLCGSSCPKTCENPDGCKSMMPTEGCFCPDGKVGKNRTCVEPRICLECDKAGHYPGDSWTKDACTQCTCDEVTRAVNCETRQCPAVETVCEQGYQTVKVKRTEDECCERFLCVPGATVSPTCEEPQQLTCGHGQVMKLDKRFDGCHQFVCQCKPADECDPIEESTLEPLEAGMERLINYEGCCPIVELICRVEQCPAPKECPKFYLVSKNDVPGKCCPIYSCEPPLDKCLYDKKYTAADRGGERELSALERDLLAKDLNTTWSDGPCRECTCTRSGDAAPQPACTATTCPNIHESSDTLEYELAEDWTRNQCCPVIKRIACIFNGAKHPVGAQWQPTADPCVRVECVAEESGVTKREKVTTCDTDCGLGQEYEEPAEGCCGNCIQRACVCDGVVRDVGEQWKSPDLCTTFTCANLNGSLQVQSSVTNCPTISEELHQDYLYEHYSVEGSCCGRDVATACLANQNTTYRIGDMWADPDGDPCVTIHCLHGSASGDDLVQTRTVKSCNMECPHGWHYTPPPPTTGECCGECVQVGCVVNGTVYGPGEEWKSGDGCTEFECQRQGDGTLAVAGQQEACPDLSDCGAAEVYEDGCCRRCNQTALPMLNMCRPEVMNPEKTLGIVRKMDSQYGVCRNLDPIPEFTECHGTCDSSTYFNPMTVLYQSECFCCHVKKYKPIPVVLVCEDGSMLKELVSVPSECACQGCLETAAPAKRPTGVKG